jgi:predicted metal-dependent peptidase
MDNAHSQRATVALQKLAEKDPAFSSLSLWCKHRDATPLELDFTLEDKDGGMTPVRKSFEFAPAYTDGKTIFYGTKFAEWTLEEKMGVCAHEIVHIAFKHINRAKKLRARFGASFDNYLFNIATDAIINQTLLMAKFQLPRPCVVLVELLKQAFDEVISAEDAIQEYDAEKLYVRLINNQDKKKKKQSGEGGASSEGGEGGVQNPSETPAEKAKEYAKGKGFGEDIDTSGKSSPEDIQKESEWSQRLARAMTAGKLAGRGIGQIGHLIADLPKSKTPWEVILRRLINKAVTLIPRQSYSIPTRRWLGMDADAQARGVAMPAYEPGMVKQSDHARVVVGIDVSGSISDQILEIFGSEIAAIGRKTGCELHLIIFDDGVISEHKLQGIDFESEVKKVEFARGGGTSFIEVIERAKAIDPSIIVILTDMYGPFGEAPGNIPVIWATPESNHPEAPFGRVITLDQ